MPRAQTGLEQLLAQSRQQSESTIFEEQFILHPYCESRMYLLCTFKIITKSPCFNGSGVLRCPRRVQRRLTGLERLTVQRVPPAGRGRGRRSAASLPNGVQTRNTTFHSKVCSIL